MEVRHLVADFVDVLRENVHEVSELSEEIVDFVHLLFDFVHVLRENVRQVGDNVHEVGDNVHLISDLSHEVSEKVHVIDDIVRELADFVARALHAKGPLARQEPVAAAPLSNLVLLGPRGALDGAS